MRLALACGRADVDQFLSELSSRQVSEWLAFERLEGPLGSWREDWRAGVVASTIANVNRDAKTRKKPYSADDFIPEWDRPVVEQTDDDQQGVFKRIAQYWQAQKGRQE